MISKSQVLQELDELIDALQVPLSPGELANGWSVECQKATLSLLSKMRDELRHDRRVRDIYLGRGLDHWGVIDGDLLEKASIVSNHLNDLDECQDAD